MQVLPRRSIVEGFRRSCGVSLCFQRNIQTRTNQFFPRERTSISFQWRLLKQNKQGCSVRQSSTAANHAVIGNNKNEFSSILLRDLCSCPRCVDTSTRQKLFSTVEIPANIKARSITESSDIVHIEWENDIPGFGPDHRTEISVSDLQRLCNNGNQLGSLPTQSSWDSQAFSSQKTDIAYQDYMEDDETLYSALVQLQTHGLMFLTNVPESEKSVSTIAERIGPIKNTFYGYTWDVRSVPQAKNVAYTSQDLGFHMDLLYMKQPPHLQFLHCIRSSAKGGASLFSDSYRAVEQLAEEDPKAFETLATRPQTFHYNHPDSHLYKQTRCTIELADFSADGRLSSSTSQVCKAVREKQRNFPLLQHVDAVAWSPPFQGPFRLTAPGDDSQHPEAISALNSTVNAWHTAATKFNALVHQPEAVYERLMKPGECVIFDNRRVLHARSAFEVGDFGTERWLRGTYVDKDPYISKLNVLRHRFEHQGERRGRHDVGAGQRTAAAASG